MASPGQSITKDNQGAAINIATWIFVVCSGISVLFRINNKIRKGRGSINLHNLGVDDYSIVAALSTAVAQSVLVSQQVQSGGLGRRWSTLSTLQIEAYEKYGYASQLLYVFSLWMSKGSCLFFYRTLARGRSQGIAVYIALAFTTLWAMAALFTVAFQCAGSPKVWQIATAMCFDQSLFWTVLEAVNGFIELGFIVQALYLLWDLQMDWTRKITVLSAFALRGISMPLIALRIVYLRKAYVSGDRSLEEAKVALLTGACMHFHIIATCAPFLRPLMEQLQMGWTVSDVRAGVGYNSIIGSRAWTPATPATPALSSGLRSNTSGGVTPQVVQNQNPIVDMRFARELSAHSHFAVTKIERDSSKRASTESNQMIIKQTRTYKVESESSGSM